MPDPTAPVDLAAWCAQTAERHRDMEQHELAMHPSPDARDAALVEWVVRVLGNPQLPESAVVVATLAARHGAAGEIAEPTRERDEARARADRLAETLREALAVWIPPVTPAEGVHARTAAWPSAADVARWRQVLDDQPTPTADPIAALDAEATARREIAGELDRLAADDLTDVWLERHGMGGQLAPPPPAILRAVAADLVRGEVHGRRERFVSIDPPGGYVCAEPDPDGPDGICGMPVEDAPCGIHHPPTTPGGER